MGHTALIAPPPGQRKAAVVTHQELSDILRLKNVRPMGLSVIREHHVFETLSKVIAQIKGGDMAERAVVLQRIEAQQRSAAATWNILANAASMYGLRKANENREEIGALRAQIAELKKKRIATAKARNLENRRYDEAVVATKRETAELQSRCTKKMQQCQVEVASNQQILTDHKPH